MLRSIALSMVLGKPLVFWLGLLSMSFILGAIAVVVLNKYSKVKIGFEWHMRLAGIGVAFGLAHVALAMSAFF